MDGQMDTDAHTRTVNDMFGRMAGWYDFQNHAFSLGLDFWWRRNLVRSAAPGPSGTMIDMAAGTLDVALGLCRRYPEVRVIAVDICEPMLDYGMKRKTRPDEKGRIDALVADVRDLPLEAESADAVTMAFGIRNIRPREDALREMRRVLLPGGSACILEFAPVALPFFGRLYHGYLRNCLPRLAGMLSGSGEAYRYFAESIEQFPPPEKFCDELRSRGFPFVRHTAFALGIAHLFVAIKA
jgi:demethylmenaquinone methyltransferase/2-methoxy-6-polyprenyl-1,4-benzoquinol methylase